MQSGSRVAPAQDALTQLSLKLRGPASSADCRIAADRAAHFIVTSRQIIDTFTLNHTVVFQVIYFAFAAEVWPHTRVPAAPPPGRPVSK